MLGPVLPLVQVRVAERYPSPSMSVQEPRLVPVPVVVLPLLSSLTLVREQLVVPVPVVVLPLLSLHQHQ